MAKKLQKVAKHGNSKDGPEGLLSHPLSAKKLGYARVSTEEQDLSVQLTALEKAGCDRIYKEKISAVDARRDQLRLLRKQAEAGDTIIIHAYSRLSRNLGQLLEIVDDFKKRGIAIKSLTEPHIDPFTTSGRLVLSVTGAVAEAKVTINQEPTCPCCGTSGFDDWWHDKSTSYAGCAIKARLKCHGCGKFFSTTQYPDGVNHSSVGF